MTKRKDRLPGLQDDSVVVLDDVLEHLRLWKSETLDTVAALRASREAVEANRNRLENPNAAAEYLAFFTDFFVRSAAEFDRVIEEVPQQIRREHVDGLRQIASNSALEQRRCVIFRDKWINKILAYEDMRPLLDGISMATRNQLSDFRELNLAAARLEALGAETFGPESGPQGPSTAFGRREMFNRLFKR